MKTFLCSGSTAIKWVIFTSREQGLGQGDIFYTCVLFFSGGGVHYRSHDWGLHPEGGSTSGASVCRGRVCIQGERVSASRGKMVCIHGKGGLPTGRLGRPPENGKEGGTHPTGMLPCVISYFHEQF